MKYFIIITVSMMIIILLFFYIQYHRQQRHHHRHYRHHDQKCRKAIAVFTGPDVHGTVLFSEEQGQNIKIDIQVKGLRPNSLHGFHVHEAGDLSDGCTSACKHFNPYHTLHGCPGMIERHVGDLGNLKTDENGIANYSMTDDVIQLRGKNDIIGRCLIIHEDRDDCGRGGNEESTKTGNAGKRMACAVIGYSKLNFIP